ncbi:TlpA family protein disulfide reductase [Aestuariibacter halophilus]|uniref:TlpA family protein disulfide reductase n=1 Tax=Fluctibacter halophilus TaxID=226011 RepID=A0ABS8G6X1_9ALTE|nr:TlpA disulfide reductase family protein [Aestuariibacter halophilus]MCC2615429.1 TlpA family protein disulfide reductase [Aestuariibacter halophilus]
MSENSETVVPKTRWQRLKWLREGLLWSALLFAIMAWQGRDLLPDDGTVTVPHRVLPSLQGALMPLHQSGQRTLVYFFAPWCQVCAVSIGSLESMTDEDIRVVAVALDFQAIDEVQRFVRRHEVQVPVLLGDTALRQQFAVKGYPTYYIIDGQGKVVAGTMGYSTGWGMQLRNYLSRD